MEWPVIKPNPLVWSWWLRNGTAPWSL